MDSDDQAPPPPPPPPPHGKKSRMPDGDYNIFVVPPYSVESGFVYYKIPSMQVPRNAFLLGYAAALLTVGVWKLAEPVVKVWFATVMQSGGIGVIFLVAGVGVAGWAWGKTQAEKREDPGPEDGKRKGGGSQRYEQQQQQHQHQHQQEHNHQHQQHHHQHYPNAPPPNYGPPPQQPNPPPPPPPPQSSEPQPEPQEMPKPEPPPPPKPEPAPPPPKAEPRSPPRPNPTATEWEKAREETRRREEARKRAEELQKKREAAQKLKEEAERAAKAKAEKEKWEQARAREKEQREREARERITRERLAREKEAREKDTREREAREQAEKEKTAAAAAAATGTPPKPAPKATSSKYEKATARSFAGTEETHSYRPYDSPGKKGTYKSSASSVSGVSESSYAASHSTARTTPPPSMRGPYSTKDPDKIQIKAVYLFSDSFPTKPSAQLVANTGSVTDGLILHIKTEGLFIDDDIRGVPQREWDVKAWTLKLVEDGAATGRTARGDALHVLRATVRDADNKKYCFVLDATEAYKVAVGLAKLKKGSQVRSLHTGSMKDADVKSVLGLVGWL